MKTNTHDIEEARALCAVSGKWTAALSRLIRNGFWPKTPPEAKAQILVNTWMQTIHPEIMCVHIENEGNKTRWESFVTANNGLRSGMPDVMIYEKRGGCIGCALELKIYPSLPTKNQEATIEMLNQRGWATGVIREDTAGKLFDATISAINSYLKLP